MNLQADLLNSPGFFLCEKYRCILRVEICAKRHKRSSSGYKDSAREFWMCVDCQQGKQNMQISEKKLSVTFDASVEQHHLEAVN